MRKLILNPKITEAISINELAYNLEKSYPHLNFFEINELVQRILINKSEIKTNLVPVD